MTQDFVKIFSEMGWLSGLLLTIGLVFCFIEIYLPGYAYFGLSGAGCLFVGIIARCVEGINFVQFLILVSILASLLLFGTLILIVLIKFGIIKDKGFFSTVVATPEDYQGKEYRQLVGKVAKTTSTLALDGCIKFRGKIYDAMSVNNMIEQNKYVTIVKVENNHVVVKKFGSR